MTTSVAASNPAVDEDRIVCVCFNVRKSTIDAHLRDPEATFQQLVDATGITTKCTACRLNIEVLIGEAVADAPHKLRDDNRRLTFPMRKEFRNCGFFMSADGVETELRIANPIESGLEPSDLAAYRVEIAAYAPSGKVLGTRHLGLDPDGALVVRLSEFGPLPAFGWFSADLVPSRDAFVGNARPQVALIGPGWFATYHMQLVRDASRRRTVSVAAVDGRYRTRIPVLNVASRPATVTLELVPFGGGPSRRAEMPCPAGGLVVPDLDEVFGIPAAGADLSLLVVESDVPTRRYVLNSHADGTISLDHFPNTR